MTDQERFLSDTNFLLCIIFHLEDMEYTHDDIYKMFKDYNLKEKYYKDRMHFREMGVAGVAERLVMLYKENENDKEKTE